MGQMNYSTLAKGTLKGDRKAAARLISVVEDEEELISYLHDRGLTPGTQVTLAEPAPVQDAPVGQAETTVALRVGERTLIVPGRVAYALWVTRADA